jgi:uncharacterized membrane protein
MLLLSGSIDLINLIADEVLYLNFLSFAIAALVKLTIPDWIGFVSGRACHIPVAVISMRHLVAKIFGPSVFKDCFLKKGDKGMHLKCFPIFTLENMTYNNSYDNRGLFGLCSSSAITYGNEPP